MESIIAAGIIRHMANAIRAGKDVDTALREGSQGTTKAVRDLILDHIQASMPSKKKATPEAIRNAILTAEGALP